MEWRFSQRAQRFGPNIFNILEKEKQTLLAEGRQVFNFSIGTPDFAPSAHILEAVSKAAQDPLHYRYAINDLPELKAAVQRWYARRYDVTLATSEIMSVYGSQEGIAHIAMTLCDPGDIVLVPSPCYPIFEIGPYLHGAEVVYYPLLPERGYLPDLDAIADETLRRAKMMIVSYPANPVGAVAPKSFYETLVAFARRYHLLIVHDNAYSEILYDGAEGGSFLSIPGAREIGVEFNSLSKTYNLTGLRISFLLGNAAIIEKFHALRSQIDYGTCLLMQYAAIAALDGPQEQVAAQREEYQRRRDALCGGLRTLGWPVPNAKGTMFVWAPLPHGWMDSDAFCMELLTKTGVICAPGSSFGAPSYVRFALVLDVPQIQAAIAVIAHSNLLDS